jgi:glc operon protein GlcG
MDNRLLMGLAVGAALIFSAKVSAQQPPAPPPYGSGVTLDQAKKTVAAAEAEAKKNGWRMAIVVVSNAGDLIHFSRIDDTQFGSTDVAIRKAKSAAAFRRPTKVFQDALTANPPALPILTLGAIAVEGGFPLVESGKVIGAIGCSGGTGAQDSQACQVGVDTIK